MRVTDFIADALVQLGVRHVFGVGGANIEDLFSAVQRRRPALTAVLCKHEHGAGSAADAYSRLRGFGAVMVTSGGGAMNLVHALAEAYASAVPILAIVGEPPSDVQGRGAFQDTSGIGGAVDALAVFRAVTTWAGRVEDVAELPRLLGEAVDAARGTRPGPAVLLVSKDRQCAELEPASTFTHRPALSTPDRDATLLAAKISEQRPVVIIAGADVARADAQDQLLRLSDALDAGVAVAPDARDAFDNHHPHFLGVAGAMGHAPVVEALKKARVVILAGTRLPLLARVGLERILLEKVVVSLGREPPFVSTPAVHVACELRAGLEALVAALRAPTLGVSSVVATGGRFPGSIADYMNTPAVLSLLEKALPDRGVVLVDAGNTGASAVYYLQAPRGGRWLVAMGMAGMGYTYGAAIGAAFASGQRCIVVSGDGAFFMHGLEIHTAVEHQLPITYLVLNNRAHGMCLVRERVLLDENSGYNTFLPSHLARGLGAMFPSLRATDARDLGEISRALEGARNHSGPTLIAAELGSVEIPPFAAFRAAGSRTVERGVDHATARS